jgi:large subunit ribosomal protein L10
MRPEKISIFNEVYEDINSSDYVYIVDFSGSSVELLSSLREKLSDTDSQIKVVKNSLLKKTAEKLGWDSSTNDYFVGPTAIVTGNGEATTVAKELVSFAKANKKPVMKGGVLGIKVFDASGVDTLAKIPPREIVLSQVVGTIAAPMSGLVGVFSQKVATLLYVLKAIEEKKAS